MQVETLESELSAARKSAAGHANEMSDLSKRLSDAMGRTAKLDDKVGLPHILRGLKAWQTTMHRFLHSCSAAVLPWLSGREWANV